MLSVLAMTVLVLVALFVILYCAFPAFREQAKGFRGIVATWAPTVLMFAESVLGLVGNTLTATGQPIVSLNDLKFAVIVSLVTTAKLAITDALPRLRGELQK